MLRRISRVDDVRCVPNEKIVIVLRVIVVIITNVRQLQRFGIEFFAVKSALDFDTIDEGSVNSI